MSLLNWKTSKKCSLVPATIERIKEHASPCDCVEPSEYFDTFVKPCCIEYDKFFDHITENQVGRFCSVVYLSMGASKAFDGSYTEFPTLYEAYYDAREKAYNLDKQTRKGRYSDYAVHWEIKMLIPKGKKI